MIGSSLLFIHDNENANIWMIDFAKVRPITADLLDKNFHYNKNEDGFLIGILNLIDIFKILYSS